MRTAGVWAPAPARSFVRFALETVFGDPDVTEAHVDACLVHAMPSAHEHTEPDFGRPARTRVTDGANLTGLIRPALIKGLFGH
jgi:hypothetical protein